MEQVRSCQVTTCKAGLVQVLTQESEMLGAGELFVFLTGLVPLIVLVWIGVTLRNIRKELTAIRRHVTRWPPPPLAGEE